MTATQEVKAAGRRASSSHAMQVLARGGLVARGVIYILVGGLAVQIAAGAGGKEADKQGALQTVAGTPGGTFSLWLIAIGFGGLALWRYAEALYGQAGPDGDKATKRLASLGRGVFYTAGCASIVAFILDHSGESGDQKSKAFTAKAMEFTGGRWLVGAVGLGLIGWGTGNLVNALRRKFLKRLRLAGTGQRIRRAVEIVGVVGRSARGIVYGVAGGFLVYAAVTFDPGKAEGVDGTLRQFARTPAGPWLLGVIAVGLVVYGVYSFCEARWRDVEPG